MGVEDDLIIDHDDSVVINETIGKVTFGRSGNSF